MSSSQQDVSDARPRKLVHDVRERVHETRAKVRSEMLQSGGVSESTRQQFASVLLVYLDVLKEHREDKILVPPWDDRGVDWLDKASRQTVTKQRAKPGMLTGSETVQQSALLSVDINDLLDVADSLDTIAKDLGFTAQTPDHTPEDSFDKVDLIHLMKVRGHDDAADEVAEALKVTGGDDNGDDTEAVGPSAAEADD